MAEAVVSIGSEDIDRAFEDVFLIEEKLKKQGFDQGRQVGLSKLKSEGFELGFSKGQEVGREIGFYLGFCQAWMPLVQKLEDKKQQKVLITLDKLQNLCQTFPDSNDINVDITEPLSEIRAKFKKACALLNLKTNTNPAESVGQDSGVDTDDSSMSNVSVAVVIPNPPEPPEPISDSEPVASGSGLVPAASTGPAPMAAAVPSTSSTFQMPEVSTSNSGASSVSGSNPVTPEPSVNNPLSPPPATSAMFPPPLVIEDGYLGDMSDMSDGGTEKNFPMPPDKFKKLLLENKLNGSDLAGEGTSRDAVEPPAGISFDNLKQQQFGYKVSRGRSHHDSDGGRKMKPVLKSRFHHNNGNHWSHVKSHILSRKLSIAANTNNIEAVERLLNMGTDANAVDEHKRTALHFAAAKGYTQVVRLLLAFGSDPNQKDSLGNTPLHLAACTMSPDNVGVVTLLLRSGTNVGSMDNHGRNPLQLAQSKLKLLQKYKGETSDISAVKTEVTQVIEMMKEYLLRRGHGTNKEYNDLLDSFSERFTLHNNHDDMKSDLQNLLESLGNLQV